MRSKDLFLVGIRLLGVWTLYQFATNYLYLIQLLVQSPTAARSQSAPYVLEGVFQLAVGLILLFAGPKITNALSWKLPYPLPYECKNCGYDLRGGHEKCPECGWVVPPDQK